MEFTEAGIDPVDPGRSIDTMRISQKIFKGKMRHNLQSCVQRERIMVRSDESFHSATYDVIVTAELFHSQMSHLSKSLQKGN